MSSQDDEHASDDALLRRVATGDRAAFEQLYARHAPWLAVRLRRRCRDDELAADLIQETFLAVWRFAGSYSGTEQVGGWLWTIASRRLIDAHRRSAARVRTVGEPRDEHAATVSAEDEALRDAEAGGDRRDAASCHGLRNDRPANQRTEQRGRRRLPSGSRPTAAAART